MKYSEYKGLYEKLQRLEDVGALAETTHYDRELLMVIYTQRVVREATRHFYKVKMHSRRMHYMWKRGRSFVEIGKEFNFPPVLAALITLEEERISRKRFWRYLSDLSKVEDARLQRDLAQACSADAIYSPEGTEKQYERGRWGEAKLQEWLNRRNISFKRENELRAQFDKTPDVILESPVDWNGCKVCWIESKATFGDPIEVRRHIKGQLAPYCEIFGDGMVVYWFGFVEDVDLKLPSGVSIVDRGFFEHDDEKNSRTS